MKKPKRSFEWQENDVDSAENTGFDLDVPEEEEIIELEDILELDEEAPDPDAKLLEPDLESSELSELDLKDLELEFDPDEEGFLGDDLSSEFSFDDEKASDDNLDFDLKTIDSGRAEEEDELPEELDETPLSPVEAESETESPATSEIAIPVSDSSLEEPKDKPSLEELVDQIEDRLLKAVHQIVESRLPDIVRTVLREEIDRLQLDSEKEKE